MKLSFFSANQSNISVATDAELATAEGANVYFESREQAESALEEMRDIAKGLGWNPDLVTITHRTVDQLQKVYTKMLQSGKPAMSFTDLMSKSWQLQARKNAVASNSVDSSTLLERLKARQPKA